MKSATITIKTQGTMVRAKPKTSDSGCRSICGP